MITISSGVLEAASQDTFRYEKSNLQGAFIRRRLPLRQCLPSGIENMDNIIAWLV